MKKKVVYICIVAILLVVMLIVGFWNIFKNNSDVSDNILFFRMYPEVGKDNIYKIIDLNSAINLLNNGTGIVFFGFPSCIWCQKYVSVLNEAAIEYDMDNIYYVDIKKDRENNTKEYQTLLTVIHPFLSDEKKVYVPDVYFVKGGQLLGHNNDTATFYDIDPEEYYTEENRATLKQNLIKYIKQIKPAVCNDETRECT